EVPEAPDRVHVGQILLSALDVAREANEALRRPQASLDLLVEQEQVLRAQGAGRHDLAMMRLRWFAPLAGLGRLGEAQGVLEDCLATFRDAQDLPNEARVLSALAALWNERQDTG